jgi:hypothetical protein
MFSKHWRLNNVVAAYFYKICIQLAASHSVIIIWVVTSRMKFHTVCRQMNANY